MGISLLIFYEKRQPLSCVILAKVESNPILISVTAVKFSFQFQPTVH